MRKYLTIYDEAVSNRNHSLLNFLIYEEKKNYLIFHQRGKENNKLTKVRVVTPCHPYLGTVVA
jgi:hypothetical protein